jgi:hypothetical protein
MNWAWSQHLPPTLKLVLMALSDAADDGGDCWPSVGTLAAKCCTSQRTIQRVLKDFEVRGLLLVTPRFNAVGRQSSNAYRLDLAYPDKLSPLPARCQGEGDMGVTPGVSEPCHPGGDKAMSPLEPPTEPSTESPLQPPGAHRLEEPVIELEYPSSLGDADRKSISRALESVDAGGAQSLLDELAGVLATPGTIKTTPTRWFRALVERYEQGKFFPTAGVLVAERRARKSALKEMPLAHEPRLKAAPSAAVLQALVETRRNIVARVPVSTGRSSIAIGGAKEGG